MRDAVHASTVQLGLLEELLEALVVMWTVHYHALPSTSLSHGWGQVNSHLRTLQSFSDEGAAPRGWRPESFDTLCAIGPVLGRTGGAVGPREIRDGVWAAATPPDDGESGIHVLAPDDLVLVTSGAPQLYRWHGDRTSGRGAVSVVEACACPKWFLYYHLRRCVPLLTQGTTVGRLNLRQLLGTQVALPPSDVLAAMDAAVAPLWRQVHEVERLRNLMRQTTNLARDGLVTGSLVLERVRGDTLARQRQGRAR